MRLIDADKLLSRFNIDDMCNDGKGFVPITVARQAIETAPTIDAVPVVRCGECKWHYIGGTGLHWCERLCSHRPQQGPVIPTSIHGFCSHGEKREGGEP